MACKQPGRSYMAALLYDQTLTNQSAFSKCAKVMMHRSQCALQLCLLWPVLLCLTVCFLDAVRGLGALTVRSPL